MRKEALRVALIQTKLFWEDPEANRAHFEEKIWGVGQSDLIVLPESFTTGFSVSNTQVEQHGTHTVKWMSQMASQSKAVICGSYFCKEGGNVWNRFVAAHPDGAIDTYDKRHVFSKGGEDVTSGKEQGFIEVKGWKIKPIICFDLRFPVWNRQNAQLYDVLLCVANWPKAGDWALARQEAWKTLLKARAIENQAYVLGCNRIGSDQNDLNYAGDSMVLGPLGDELVGPSERDEVLRAELEYSVLVDLRAQLPYLEGRDKFSIEL